MAIDIQKFIGRFIEEARDHLSRLGDGLAQLQARPEAAHEGDTIHALFRSAHTIKGSSRMLRLAPITALAHAMEDVLGALREGSLAFSAPLGALLYQGVDHLASQETPVEFGEGESKKPLTEAFKDLVNKEPSIDQLRRQGVKDGMRPLRLSGAIRVGEGVTTLDEVVAATPPLH